MTYEGYGQFARRTRSGRDPPTDQIVRTALGLRCMGDELEKAAVGVAEVNAHAQTPGAVSHCRSLLDADAVFEQLRGGALDRTRPLEAEVAVARGYRVRATGSGPSAPGGSVTGDPARSKEEPP